MKFIGKVIVILIVLAILSAVLTFVADHFSTIIAIIAGVGILAAVIGWNSSDQKKAQYIPIYLMNEINLPQNENYLLTEAVSQIQDGMTSFSPHDMGVKGIETTGTYYKNLFDKGYFDKERRGLYRVNATLLGRALDHYFSLINYNLNRVQSSKHKKLAEQATEMYEADKTIIRLTPTRTIPYVALAAYLENNY